MCLRECDLSLTNLFFKITTLKYAVDSYLSFIISSSGTTFQNYQHLSNLLSQLQGRKLCIFVSKWSSYEVLHEILSVSKWWSTQPCKENLLPQKVHINFLFIKKWDWYLNCLDFYYFQWKEKLKNIKNSNITIKVNPGALCVLTYFGTSHFRYLTDLTYRSTGPRVCILTLDKWTHTCCLTIFQPFLILKVIHLPLGSGFMSIISYQQNNMIKLECVFLGQTVSLVIVVICLGLGGWGQVDISLKKNSLMPHILKVWQKILIFLNYRLILTQIVKLV